MSDKTYLCTGGVGLLNGGIAAAKFAFANPAAGQTDVALVTAVTGKKIRVLNVTISTVTGATTITFNTKPSGAGSAISALLNAPIGTSGLGFCLYGHFETLSGEGLTVTTGAGNAVGVQVTYIEV